MKVILDDRNPDLPLFSPVCEACQHFGGHALHCEAFENIPGEIWRGNNNHQVPYPGDRGIKYDPQPQGWKRPMPKKVTREQMMANFRLAVEREGLLPEADSVNA